VKSYVGNPVQDGSVYTCSYKCLHPEESSEDEAEKIAKTY